MMAIATPLSILQQNYNDGRHEMDVEELLYTVLETLSTMPCPPEVEMKNYLNWSTTIISQDIRAHGENGEQGLVREWVCGVQLLTALVEVSEDEEGILSPMIPTHIFLQGVVERCLGYFPQNDDDDDDDDDDNDHATVTLFQVVCILILSIAMKHCAAPKPQRWRRVQSICMESIALFQKMFMGFNRDTVLDELHLPLELQLQLISKLYCEHLSPVLRDIFRAMEIAKGAPRAPVEYKSRAIAAGMVNVASTIYFHIDQGNVEYQSHNNIVVVVHDLIIDILTVPILDQNFIWDHPLRKVHELRKEYELSSNDYDNEDEHYSEAEMELEQQIFRDLTPLLCRDVHDLGFDFDMLCGMNVEWKEEALGIMLHIVLSHPDLMSIVILEDARVSQVFRLVFPYVPVLLALSQVGHVDSSDDAILDIGRRKLCMHKAVDIINYLFKRIDNDSILEESVAFEVSPVGAIQLLLNHAVNISSTIKSVDESLTPQELITVVKRISSLYPIQIQLSNINVLVHHCPFPFLVPMLIDLARPLVSHQSFSEINDTMAIISPFLEDMKSCFLFPRSDNENAINVDKLVENTEIYTSAVSLLRLLYLKREKDPESSKQMSDVMQNMNDMRLSFEELGESISDGNNTGGPGGKMSFRLDLLVGAFADLMSAG
jgi:hypothetical protein